jgi:hypothetical protein
MERNKKAEKRIKKPTVKLEQRNDWLKRFEMGESASKISDTDDWDVRTVRKHIEMARQEREVREARAAVLRDALEKHYFDLSNWAETLNSQIMGIDKGQPTLDDDLMESALRQHLPRSPLWACRLKYQTLHEKEKEQRQGLAKKIEQAVSTDSRLSRLGKYGMDQLAAGMVDVLKFQVDHWAEGLPGLNVKHNLYVEPAHEGFVNVRYGFAHLGKIKENQAEGVKDLISSMMTDLETAIKAWGAFQDFEKTCKEIEIVKNKLRGELAIIRLRRILPGRCKYCPL